MWLTAIVRLDRAILLYEGKLFPPNKTEAHLTSSLLLIQLLLKQLPQGFHLFQNIIRGCFLKFTLSVSFCPASRFGRDKTTVKVRALELSSWKSELSVWMIASLWPCQRPHTWQGFLEWVDTTLSDDPSTELIGLVLLLDYCGKSDIHKVQDLWSWDYFWPT